VSLDLYTAPSAREAMGRREFLKLSMAGVAGAALVGVMGSGKALARAPADSVLTREFVEAAREYRVPVELLMAMGYVNTRWEMPPPQANEYEEGDLHGWGSYGIMALVKNPIADTLGEASRLTGIPEEKLKTDRAANIRGGAALLASSQGTRPSKLGDYSGAIAGKGGRGKEYSAVSGVGAGRLYADQVLQTLKQGARKTTRGGERISLPPQTLAARLGERGEVL
jgi:hypothetical protein